MWGLVNLHQQEGDGRNFSVGGSVGHRGPLGGFDRASGSACAIERACTAVLEDESALSLAITRVALGAFFGVGGSQAS